MSDYTPIPTKPPVIPLWDTTTIAMGGASGAANVVVKKLADYCAYLDSLVTAQAASLATLGVLPLAALDYPTIATPTNLLTVVPAAAMAGGTVSVSAGVKVSLAAEITAGVSGRMGLYTTPVFTSADLTVSSTYYLRGQITGNALVIYVQKGTDADVIPAGMLGIPNGSSGGGFDSTPLDVLIAKVITGTSGTVPNVTALANAANLFAENTLTGTVTQEGPIGYAAEYSGTLDLNWARTPHTTIIGGQIVSSSVAGGVYLQGGSNFLSDKTVTRYQIAAKVTTDWSGATEGVINCMLNFSATA